jgi:hypothetical protein
MRRDEIDRNTVRIAHISCTQPPNSGGRNPKSLVISPQNWKATSVGGFPDLRKVAQVTGPVQ